MNTMRTRWAAIGAAIAVTIGAGGISLVSATEPNGALTFVPITPCRVLDTRPAPNNIGVKSAALTGGEILTVQAHGDNGDCSGIPAGASAVSLNVTALDAELPTFLTVWAAATAQPTASSLNPMPGAPPTPNAVTTQLSANGEFNIFNRQGSVNVFVDINGYYVAHHHDDRYATKAELRATQNTDTLWAVVVGDGSLSRGSNVVDTSWSGTGKYSVTFDRDVAGCVHIGSDGHNATGFPGRVQVGTATTSATPDGLYVEVRNVTGDLTDAPFHLLVVC